jgi:hypothetical protein
MIKVKFLKENENNDKLPLFSKKKAKVYDLEELKKCKNRDPTIKYEMSFIEG